MSSNSSLHLVEQNTYSRTDPQCSPWVSSMHNLIPHPWHNVIPHPLVHIFKQAPQGRREQFLHSLNENLSRV